MEMSAIVLLAVGGGLLFWAYQKPAADAPIEWYKNWKYLMGIGLILGVMAILIYQKRKSSIFAADRTYPALPFVRGM